MKPLKEELSTAQHSEFTLSASDQQRSTAYAALTVIAKGLPPEQALQIYGLTLDEVRPYLTEWNRQSSLAEQVTLE